MISVVAYLRLCGVCLVCILAVTATQAAHSEVIFMDDFESGNLSHKQGKARWTDSVRVSVSKERPRNGNYSAEFVFPGSPDLSADAFSELRFELGKVHRELWIKYDLYVPANYRHREPKGSANNKGLITLWSGTYQNAPQNMFLQFWRAKNPAFPDASIIAPGWKTGGATSMHYFNQSDLSRHNINAAWEVLLIDPKVDNGRWMTVAMHIKAADPGKDNGIVQIWKNGKKKYSVLNASNYTFDKDMNGYEFGYILGWANSGFDERTVMYVDNVIFATEAADIGLSDSNNKRPEAPNLRLK